MTHAVFGQLRRHTAHHDTLGLREAAHALCVARLRHKSNAVILLPSLLGGCGGLGCNRRHHLHVLQLLWCVLHTNTRQIVEHGIAGVLTNGYSHLCCLRCG